MSSVTTPRSRPDTTHTLARCASSETMRRISGPITASDGLSTIGVSTPS